MRALLVSAALLCLTAPALAQIPGVHDKSRVTAGSYVVDSGHTQVLFTVNHQGFTEYTGQFTQPTGTMTLDPAHPETAAIDIVFPIDKVSTTVPALDTHLKTADFFDAAKFPQGRFVSTKVTASGDTATIMGNLTLKGVTKPVTLQGRFVGAGKGRDGKTNVGFAATTTIKRSEWGVSYAIPVVSDEVMLTINAAFVAK